MKKKGKSEAETFAGAAIFFIILFVLIVSGVFSSIFMAFNDPIFEGYGALLGILFIFIIIIALFERLLGK